MRLHQLILILTCSVSIPNLVFSRHLSHRVIKRSPQLSLTVVDDEDTKVLRSHPPSPEDLEERRQALVNSLGGFAGTGATLPRITDIGLDLVGGALRNSAQVFAPLTNATRNAAKGLPRLGNVINGLTDGARSYSRQVSVGLRGTADVVVNNAIRLFTTASTRGSEVLGGVFRLMRTLLDNLTRTINSLVQNVSKGIARATKLGSQFLARNVERARKTLSNPRLLEPAKEVIGITTNLAKGLTTDFTEAQSWVNEGVRSKIVLGNALIPRVKLSSILSPLTDPEVISNSNSEPEGYNNNKKRESLEDEEVTSTDDQISPADVLQLLDEPTNEKKSNSPDNLEPSESKSVAVEESTKSDKKPLNPEKPTKKSEITKSTTESSKSMKSSMKNEIETPTSTSSTTISVSSTSTDSTTPNLPETTDSLAGASLPADSVEHLFGIASRLLKVE